MFPPVEINYLAVLVAAIVSMALGAFWYSPAGFGKQWMQLIGLTQGDIETAKQKGMAKIYAINFVGALIMMVVLAYFIDFAQAATLLEGIQTGFWVWLGFVATVMLGSILWENKPVKLYVINAGYQLVNLAVAGAILALWV